MQVKLHIDSVGYNNKDDAKKDAGKITNRITKQIIEVTPQQIALASARGQSLVLATMDGARNKENMIQQQVLALDFDNKEDGKKTEGLFYMTIQDALADPFIQENASFIYKTFSYSDDWQKFRVVFILDEPLFTNEEVSGAYQYLLSKYDKKADSATIDSSRIFFGGTEVIEVNFDNILETKGLPVAPKREYKRPEVVAKQDVKIADSGEIPLYKLVRLGEKEQVKERLSVFGNITLADEEQAVNYFRTLPLAEILGVRANPFHDLFEKDDNPSATIWQPKNSATWLYTKQNKTGRNGGKVSLDIIQVFEKLLTSAMGTPATRVLTINYLIDVTGVNIAMTEDIAKIRKEAELFKQILFSDTLKEQHPEVHKILGRYKTEINAIIDLYKMHTHEANDGELRCIAYLSSARISKMIGVPNNKVKELLNLMTVTGIFDKLDDSQVPSNILEIIKKNQTHVQVKNGEWQKRNKAREYRSNVFELKELIESFPQIDERCGAMVEAGFTKRALSKEWVQRTFGVEEANRVYPQDKERTISKKSNAITEQIHFIVMTRIKEDGYVIVNELKEELQKTWKSKGLTDYKYKQALGELLDMYDLQQKSLTNELKEKFQITSIAPNARPKILMSAS